MGQPIPIALQPDYALADPASQSLAAFVNLYAEQMPGKAQFVALPYPGEALVGSYGPIRGLFQDDRPNGSNFMVAGNAFGVVGLDGAYGLISTDIPGVDLAEFAENSYQVAFIADGRLYVFDVPTNDFRQVMTLATGDALPAVSSIACVNGLGIVTVKGSDRWYYTDLDDFRTIRALSDARAEAKPDAIVAVRIIANEPWFFGTDTSEPYTNTGEANFPFTRRPINHVWGAVARDTVRNFADSVIFLARGANGGGLTVLQVQGYGFKKISSHAVDRLLERTLHPENSRAVVWAMKGHLFYTLITDAGSVTFDQATQVWHATAFGNWPHDAAPPPSRWTAQMFIGTDNWFGDSAGRLTRFDDKITTSGGEPLIFEFTTPMLGALGQRVGTFNVEAQLEVGTGSATVNPIVQMQKITEGGRKVSAPRETRLGLQGQYGVRPRWSRLGASRDLALRIRLSGARLKVVQLWGRNEAFARS